MRRQTRPISWIKAVRKDFEEFPAQAQSICLAALTIAAEEIWVIHAFQKKSTQGIKTPPHEIEVIQDISCQGEPIKNEFALEMQSYASRRELE